MPHRTLDHTADSGIEAEADTLPALVAELATALFELVTSLSGLQPERIVEFTVSSPTPADLVVDTLSELLYRSEVEDLVFCSFRVQPATDDLTLEIEAGGVSFARIDETGPPLKAITYHGLEIEERPDGWHGRVYVDV